MVERRSHKTFPRHQPFPINQKVVIITDKKQLEPPDPTKIDAQKAGGTEDAPKKTDEANPQNPKKDKPNKNQPVEKNGYCRVLYAIGMMEANLLIEPPSGGGNWPTIEEAMALIKEEDLHNVDEKAVEEAIERRRTTPILIVRGQLAVNGKDTELKVNYEISDLHKIYIEGLVENGYRQVDYHQVKTVQTVVVGDVVAEKIMFSEGQNGVDVHGNLIEGTSGVDKPIKLGKNVEWAEDGLRIIATGGGKPVFNNGVLSVFPIHEVQGDVNFHTGNINFDGNVVIHGNVENGFKVEAEGDVVVMGYVEGALINTMGKLSIKGRVFGNAKSELICGNDFFAKQVENASISSKGTVMVLEAIMHSYVVAEKRVIVENGKGWIVGGIVRAGEDVSAKMIGSRLGTITEVESGMIIIPTVESSIKIETQGSEPNPEENSAPTTTINTKSISNTVQDTGQQSQTPVEAETPVKHYKGRIKFKEMIYPGVRVTLNASKFVIQDELKFGILTCHDGFLRLISYN